MGRKAFDLTGQSFGFLTAIRRIHIPGSPHAHWQCSCACGGQHTVRSTNLTTGAVTRCKACQADPIGAVARCRPETVVELWCTGIGQEGGFVRAVDRATGQIVARSRYSPLPQQLAGPPHMIRIIRSCFTMMETVGRTQPRNIGESWRRWMKRSNVRVELHTFTPAAKVQALWFDTSFAPGPDSIIERS